MAEKGEIGISVETISVLKDIPEQCLSSIPDCCGAYVIKVQSGKRYVGSSKTLRTRIQAHKVYNDPNISEKIISACYYQTENHMDARILEYWLIREVNPELNNISKSDVIHSGCASKCDDNCETWDTPGRYVRIQVSVPSVLEDVPVKNLSTLPNKPGVYVITTESGQRYVGSSNDICKRVTSHNSQKGPNITEPIKSVCCYETEHNTDAPILEYWYIGKLKPELNREIQPDASTWKKGSKEKLLNTSDKLHELFKELSQRICCLPDVEEVVRKNWITYQTSALKNFCIVKFTKGYLQIDFKDYKDQIKDTTGFSWKIKATQASTFHRRLELRNATQMDIALELITQAYNEMMK